MNDYYKHIPRGAKIPLNNPYAFSVSMPTVQDVIDYEEETLESKQVFKSAYPRIVFHPYIVEVINIAAADFKLSDQQLFLLPDMESAKRVACLSNTNPSFYNFHDYVIVSIDESSNDEISRYYSLMKHCGYMVFDREAEDLLNRLGYDTPAFSEKTEKDNPEKVILDILKEGYKSSDILLTNCGMNAIYAGFEVVRQRAEGKGRSLFIQYGWAYSDTIQIFKKCASEVVVIEDVSSIYKLEELLKSRGNEVAAIFLETVSNPLIEVPDIPGVYELSKKYDFPVLVDNTFATPWSVDINPYCDLIFESLTKFASGEGDLMAGTVIRPIGSRTDSDIMSEIENLTIPLYKRVKERLAYSITGYKDRVLKINRNAEYIFNYLKNKNYIKDIFSVSNPRFSQNWNKIKTCDESYCGVVSLVFKGELNDVYDNLDLPKGPSLGTEYPLVMPYTMLAHYFETKTEVGLENLNRVGLSTDLLRFSISVEDPELTINAIEKALNY